MPSRRTLLGAGATAAVTTLAGCGTAFGSGGTHELQPNSDIQPDEDATVAASDSADWRPEDSYVEANGLLFERDDDSGFVLVTEYRVESSDDWPHSGFQTSHEWESIPGRTDVTKFDSNARRTDDDPLLSVDIEETADAIEWDLALVTSKTRPLTYAFASSVDEADLSPGDRVAAVPFFAEYEQDRFFGSTRGTGSRLRLNYGDGAAEDWEPDS